MTSGRLLRAAREAAGISQHDLARRSGVPQPTISAIELGRHDANVATLSRLAASLESQVALIPSLSLTAATAATFVARYLGEGEVAKADLTIWQLANDLAAAGPALRCALAISPAPLTGDAGRDAWIAGLVEYRLGQVGVPSPSWVYERRRVADQEWPVSGVFASADVVRADTPEPFARRRVLITDDDLVST
jgi:transcriptional regulator with XRE-family HTH domain